jgi:hypothetical protein
VEVPLLLVHFHDLLLFLYHPSSFLVHQNFDLVALLPDHDHLYPSSLEEEAVAFDRDYLSYQHILVDLDLLVVVVEGIFLLYLHPSFDQEVLLLFHPSLFLHSSLDPSSLDFPPLDVAAVVEAAPDS